MTNEAIERAKECIY